MAKLAPFLATSILGVFASACASEVATDGGAAPTTERLQAVAAAGAEVMPFDLERTTHIFSDQAWGGEQVVVSDDGDTTQIALIRAHLSAEAARFAHGEFASPEHIHGQNMPGLDVMRSAEIEISYSERPQGGAITYRATDQAVIHAIHAWFAAQRSDHGAHAAH
ncbi:MAG: aspartate carbamoyltransferase [Hyphomonadaceae bacterium]